MLHGLALRKACAECSGMTHEFQQMQLQYVRASPEIFNLTSCPVVVFCVTGGVSELLIQAGGPA